MKGIHVPFLYVGMANTVFGFHLEDGDLSSISYLHSGKPKIWYVVPDSERLTKLVQTMFPSVDCNLFIRHKNVLIPPSVLVANGISFSRVSNFQSKIT